MNETWTFPLETIGCAREGHEYRAIRRVLTHTVAGIFLERRLPIGEWGVAQPVTTRSIDGDCVHVMPNGDRVVWATKEMIASLRSYVTWRP